MSTIGFAFLCGFTFVMGAVCAVVLCAIFWSIRDKNTRNDVSASWKKAVEQRAEQLMILERVAQALERIETKK